MGTHRVIQLILMGLAWAHTDGVWTTPRDPDLQFLSELVEG